MQIKLKLFNYALSTSWLSLLFTLALMTIFVKLGNWQLHKAQIKQQIETQFAASLQSNVVNLKDYLSNTEVLLYKNIEVEGVYDVSHQFLIDNQTYQGRAGFYVITPFKIKDTNSFILVNRGWVAGYANHNKLPSINTPTQSLVLQGMVWKPSEKIFSLEDKKLLDGSGTWPVVWQNLDMSKYKKIVNQLTLPVIIKLSPNQQDDGFVREWTIPESDMAKNLSYAYQWYGFTFAAFAIWLITHIRKIF